MKYSEAIRLGSMLYPQCYCSILWRGEKGVSVCANGAAALALGLTLEQMEATTRGPAPDRVMWAVPTGHVTCPVCLDLHCEPVYVIAHMNDLHRWTRERIADWLAASGHDFEIELAAKAPEPAPASEVCA